MKFLCDIQRASKSTEIPDNDVIQNWVNTALAVGEDEAELTVRIVDEEESRSLNHQFRNKNKATNVLAFPFPDSESLPIKLLGDLIICAPILSCEAKEQGKSLQSHWAHIIIHGCLHLLGFDHIKPDEQKQMEALEIRLLASLGIDNPYEEDIIENEKR